MNNDSFKQTAIQQCQKSAYKQRMGAVVVYRGKIVGRGCNKVHHTGVPRLDGLHAEIEALNKTTAQYREGCTVYVCRVNKRGDIVLAKPCAACEKKMKKIGVKYVWYSTYGSWEKMSVG
jgi:tRNA(Arg) A34 adenosine deaminase TadA